MNKEYYAHSKEGEPPSEWHRLNEHLQEVAKIASSFAEAFGALDWGYLAGLWHDIGKYSEEFQQRLFVTEGRNAHVETKPGRVDHSTAGAKHGFSHFMDKGKLLAYAIAGHHAGLPNGKANESSDLATRLEKPVPDHSSCPEKILNIDELGELPFTPHKNRFGFQISFFARMLFSCLVDADFLDTEQFMDSEKSLGRKGYPSLTALTQKLTEYLEQLVAKAPTTPINKQRAEILKSCLEAADWAPGLFSLTVPTGGGKTLSSLAFALKHALKNNLNRVIYVIPYTSIIEQNAAVFRDVLGDKAVLEHHSNYEPKEEDHRSRLAAENWDAPLVVTTNVQFFESLFSYKPSLCRKIHNIAESVVILDEAQMLPMPLLKPSLEALRELASNYRTTIVLCTATQPALSTTETFKDGLDGVREIIPNPVNLYHTFKRVHTKRLFFLSDYELAEKIKKHEQVLCVVNTRKHARLVYERLNEQEGRFHLSALMCPTHRTETFTQIRDALAKGRPCKVISTQLIEAGVDIDFPVVFRSAAGIDSIAQAAGRCNREGQLSDAGEVYVFSPESALPPGHFRQTAETAEAVMRHHDDPLSLEAVEEYFRIFYWMKGARLDEYGILNDLSSGMRNGDFPFRLVAKKFKIIKDGMDSLIIAWNEEANKIIDELRYGAYPAWAARRLQRFTIQVYPQVLRSLQVAGTIERFHDQYSVLINSDLYRDDLGLCPEDPTFHEVESLFA